MEGNASSSPPAPKYYSLKSVFSLQWKDSLTHQGLKRKGILFLVSIDKKSVRQVVQS